MRKNIFFDFCGTITATNNTYDFIYYYLLKRKKILQLILFVFFDNLNIFKNFIPLLSKQKIEIFLRKLIFNLLKGEKKENIFEEAYNFAKIIIKKNYFDKEKIEVIRKNLKNGNNVFILSSSIDPVIENFFEILKIKKINILSSRLKFDNFNIFTGEVEDYLFAKKKLILNYFGLRRKNNLMNSQYYTDNSEDQKIKNLFDEFLLINSFKKKVNQSYIGTVNKNNFKLTYFPFLYYLISRPNSFIFFFFNEFLIFVLYFKDFFYVAENYFFYLIFFLPIYELSVFFNDYYGIKKEKYPTLRINKSVKFDGRFFFFLRLLFVFFLIYFFQFGKKFLYLSIFNLTICILGFIHSFLETNKRFYTMTLLRILKLMPFFFLVSEKIYFLDFLFLVFLIQFFPIMFYFFDKNKNLNLDFIKKSFLIYALLSLIFIFSNKNHFLLIFLYSFLMRYLSFYNYLRKI